MDKKEKESLNDIALGNSTNNEEQFDKCTLDVEQEMRDGTLRTTCGFRTQDGFCLNKDRCAYHLSEKYISDYDPNEKPTVELLLQLFKKADKELTKADVLAMIPEDEMQSFKFFDEKNKDGLSAFVVDRKGNIFNLRTGQIIRRNLKM